jgi:hypothetical protein
MLTQTIVESALLKWMQEFLEQPNSSLGNWAPCPYARAARINNKIKIIEGTLSGDDIVELINTPNWEYEAYIYWYPIDTPLKEFAELNRNLNKIYRDKDVVVLGNHPEFDEIINGVKMNFDLAALQIVQRLSALNQASEKLEKQGYYDTWPKEAYDDVVVRRRQGI